MKIRSIEPTPSPNVMKLNLTESLPAGTSYNYTATQKDQAPPHLRDLLAIEGVKGIFQVMDFLSVERMANADWEKILPVVTTALGQGGVASRAGDQIDESFGEVQVQIQRVKGIPLQVKLTQGDQEKRFGLPERFQEAVYQVQSAIENHIFDRRWVEESPRYGEMESIGEQVVEELAASYTAKRLQQLVEKALRPEKDVGIPKWAGEAVDKALDLPDWESRFAALDQWEPTIEHLNVLDKALSDEKTAIRRLAVVKLGYLESAEIIPYLEKALQDSSAVVRRTAGDGLSDLGDPIATPAMCEALQDRNKLVRWRAARFLYEVGDERALPALKESMEDPEFEVRLQVQMAVERIERGEEASGTVWQQMARRKEDNTD
ncbi:conserved virulence factor C family protein [Risungbinella massiliensis]|uniref:conserved virulence factor C family protein n=1 Tax=Risungbinella massiliensis TaxID=1329796 RepID=UPI0005CB8946|nr:conserved virulence factor C family protein [Risungbinella massiliensis]